MRKCFNSLILTLFLSLSGWAQLDSSDVRNMATQDFVQTQFDVRKVQPIKINSRNPLVKYNPVTLSFVGAMYFYQGVLSPQLSTHCPYEISCSNFGKQAVHEYGLIKGVALAADRVMRCNEIAAEDIAIADITSEGKIYDPLDRYSMKTYKHQH